MARGYGASTLVIAITALISASCSDNSTTINGPIVVPPAPDHQTGPAPVGRKIYAVDLANRLVLFGSESVNTVSDILNITGVPILKRIVGIDFRPSNKKLYGIGTDSRVYTINTTTGKATAVSSVQFTPKIIDAFEIHFGMGFEPDGKHIRLVSTESGGYWSINVETGKVDKQGLMKFKAGDKNFGKRPALNGIAYLPLKATGPNAAALRNSFAMFDPGEKDCTNAMYAIDAELAEYIGGCGDAGDVGSMGPLPGILGIAGCGEVKFDPPGGLWASMVKGTQDLNNMGTVDPETGWITWKGKVPDSSPIQGFSFEPEGTVTGNLVAVKLPKASDFTHGGPLPFAPRKTQSVAQSLQMGMLKCTD